MSIFKLLKKENSARLGEVKTVHGIFKTPCFMNVGTLAAIKGGVSSWDLVDLKCQVELCNTYHLHLRPGDEVIRKLGGLQKFMSWNRPTLTDSGGFQVFSLAKIRRIEEEGVYFSSHLNGEKIFMGPEQSVEIQSNLGSTIAMAFDECIANPSTRAYTKASAERTVRWLERCLSKLQDLNSKKETINQNQLLFGINQGSTFLDIRQENMKQIAALDCDGYAIGGLAVGETKEQMYAVIDHVEPFMPQNKPRYLMGVGKPGNIIEAVYRGVDMFDCVMPTRNARHAHVNTWSGVRNLLNLKYETDPNPIDKECDCLVCRRYSRAYLRHLFKAKEMLASRLCVMHNLYFYNTLMEKIREAICKSNFCDFRRKYAAILDLRI